MWRVWSLSHVTPFLSKGAWLAISENRQDMDSQNPTLAWDRLKVKQVVKKVSPKKWSSAKPDNHTRFVCISGE